MRALAIGLVRLYQLAIRPLLPANTCKYHPSCSHYAIDAIREFGVLRGGVLAAWRLLRCNPWSHGGVDHVADQRLFRLPGRRLQTHAQAKPPRADSRHRRRRRRAGQRIFKARAT